MTICLFALLGRCDSEFDVKRSVLSGASGRRSFREAACLYLPLRQIQRCRDLNPPRPGCKHFSVPGQLLGFFGFAPAQVLVEMELLLELKQLGVCVRRPQPSRHSTLTSDCKKVIQYFTESLLAINYRLRDDDGCRFRSFGHPVMSPPPATMKVFKYSGEFTIIFNTTPPTFPFQSTDTYNFMMHRTGLL